MDVITYYIVLDAVIRFPRTIPGELGAYTSDIQKARWILPVLKCVHAFSVQNISQVTGSRTNYPFYAKL